MPATGFMGRISADEAPHKRIIDIVRTAHGSIDTPLANTVRVPRDIGIVR
jgi:hypothetical protein